MEGFPSPFWSLKAILWDWSYFSEGLISLYAIPKNCAVIHFFGIAWSDFQSSRFVTWPICYSLLIKKKFLRGESNPSPLDKTCMLYQLSYWGMVEMSALKLIYKTKQFFFRYFCILRGKASVPGQCFGRFFLAEFFFSQFVFLPIFFHQFFYCFFSCQTHFYLWLIFFGQFFSSQILFWIFGLRNLGFLMIDNAAIKKVH